MSLWDWAVEVYARPGVSAACLALQTDHRQNVLLLLAAAWAAKEGRALPLPEAIALTRDWDGAVVSPLRAVRTEMKVPRAAIPDDQREAVRERLKTVELQAERLLLTALETLAGPMDQTPTAGFAAVASAASAWARAGDLPLPPLPEIKTLSSLISYDSPHER